MNDEKDQEEQAERPRPRIIDKRVSARSAEPKPSSESPPSPAPPEPERAPEPAPEPRPPPAAAPSADRSEGAEPDAPAAPADTTARPTDPAGEVWTPEQEAEAQQLAREIAERPSEDWVLNVAITLANVAGAKLDLGVPEDARLAIDSLEALVRGVGNRLGDAEAPLRQTLAQLQLAYAQTVAPPPSS